MDADRQVPRSKEQDEARRKIMAALMEKARAEARVRFEPMNLFNPPPSAERTMAVRG